MEQSKFSKTEPESTKHLILNINAPFQIYKVGDSLFQISDINIDYNFKQNIISILKLGNKFVPNYFFNNSDFFNHLLNEIDNSLLNLNRDLYLSKDYSKINSNIISYENIDLEDFKINDDLIKIILNKMRIYKKPDPDSIFISKDMSILRSKIHSNLFNEYDNIKIKPNISFTQLKYLMKFKKEKNFKIINCDKNVGNAIISNDLYIFCAVDYLNTDSSFINLSNNPWQETVNHITQQIKQLSNYGNISESLEKSLLKNINNSKLGSFTPSKIT